MNAVFLTADTRGSSPAKSVIVDDKAMLRAAVELTRDLGHASPIIYWGDLLASVFLGYGSLYLTVKASSTGFLLITALVSALALYRAGSFIHELTHIKHSSLPGFRFGWNLLVGVPLLVPAFMYEGVHTLHHARTRYGTADDPEYLPLALMRPYTLSFFVIISAFAPLALLLRFAVLAPLSFLVPPLRRLLIERYSGLVINPKFRRRPPEGELKRQWLLQESAACLWAITFLMMAGTGILSLRSVVIILGVAGGAIMINQVRTLVAHLWENEGAAMSVTAQFLDSVNVPPPALLPALWAPVGLRYHAVHHLLPSVPYHALGEAHRRLSAMLPADSQYHRASYAGLPGLVSRLIGSTFRGSPKPD
jgi:fatty acid desaturase